MAVIGGLIVFSIIGALADSGDEETNTVAREATTAPRDTSTSQEEEPSDSPSDEEEDGECLSVPAEIVRGIEEGLTTSGQGTLRNARAVKSDDPEGYLISADIQASGLEGDDDIARVLRDPGA